MKFQAFTTAAVQDGNVRAKIKEALVGNIEKGGGIKEFKQIIGDTFDKAGLSKLSNHQIRNIYDTNTAMAYGAGQMKAIVEVSDMFPYWRYSATLDSKTRPEHRALHGKIFIVGDFTFFPPISFKCRCTAIPMTARQAGKYPQSDMPTPSDKRKIHSSLSTSEFVGNKQENYIKWLKQNYDKADNATKHKIDQAVATMQKEVTEAAYQSTKELFKHNYIKRVEKEFLANKRVLANAEKLGLSRADAFRAYVYTDFNNGLSSELAKLSYQGIKPEKWSVNQLSKFKKDFTKTLKKLPAAPGVSYRNLDHFPAELLKQYKPGNTVVWDGFSSTTTNKIVYADREVRLVIFQKSARSIDAVSKYPKENEALLQPGTRLEITLIDTEKVGQVTIYMNEI